MAERGHVSVAIDRLGNGDSGMPGGNDTCCGSEADVKHQIVDLLRSGAYSRGGADSAAFEKVFLGGSSVGGLTANITAYSSKNVDGVFNRRGATPRRRRTPRPRPPTSSAGASPAATRARRRTTGGHTRSDRPE